jgi:hypothetical protein
MELSSLQENKKLAKPDELPSQKMAIGKHTIALDSWKGNVL